MCENVPAFRMRDKMHVCQFSFAFSVDELKLSIHVCIVSNNSRSDNAHGNREQQRFWWQVTILPFEEQLGRNSLRTGKWFHRQTKNKQTKNIEFMCITQQNTSAMEILYTHSVHNCCKKLHTLRWVYCVEHSLCNDGTQRQLSTWCDKMSVGH